MPATPAPTTPAPARTVPAELRTQWDCAPAYLNTATSGLAPRATAQAVRAVVDDWATGRVDVPGFDASVVRARAAFARLVGVDVSRVAIGAQVSAMVATVATALTAGARVVVVADDFTSVTYPFLAAAAHGVQVRAVALEHLAEAVADGTDWVAFSLVQSADGRIADTDAVLAAAAGTGARTLVDLTQAGWLPVDASHFDVTVTSAYKWLCTPRGAGFLTVREDAAPLLHPYAAGWYAGADVWASVYGCDLRLADDARRFDVSPAWFAWSGAAPALELFADADIPALAAHDVALADAVRAGLGLPPAGSAIVAVPDPDGRRALALAEAGVTAAVRAGAVRLSFHVWNDEADVDRVLTALAR